jgi:hypothetical protein
VKAPKDLSCEIGSPVLLNCWKHHARFIKSKISIYREAGEFDFAAVRKELLRIGESLMDLYLGELTPKVIAGLIISSIKKRIPLNRDNFILWLKEGGNDYRMIELKDKSVWTLRLGEKEEKYIHIHPSRYSPGTIRVRAITLKSAILYLILSDEHITIQDNLLFLNRIRKDYLNQPPLKLISSKSSLPRLISVLGGEVIDH